MVAAIVPANTIMTDKLSSAFALLPTIPGYWMYSGAILKVLLATRQVLLLDALEEECEERGFDLQVQLTKHRSGAV